jgi:CRISPR-associated protein Csd2
MTLSKKIDFSVIFQVNNANPNGDPLNGNRPRNTASGHGEVTDVCLKRKLRDRLQEDNKEIFVQSDDRRSDDHLTLKARFDAARFSSTDQPSIAKSACEKWFDVRAFGQLFAYKSPKKSGGKKGEVEEGGSVDQGTSIPVRGPVTIQSAFSIEPVDITSTQITKSVSGEGDGKKRASDTMGMKHRIDRGVYLFHGSISPQLAERTGFSDDDALAIKNILPKMFENDGSSARPDGSMQVLKVIWCEHPSKAGVCSSAKVHQSVEVDSTGTVTLKKVDGLHYQEIDGY